MTKELLTPYIVGRGLAGQAIAKSISLINTVRTEAEPLYCSPHYLERDTPFSEIPVNSSSLLCVANPTGLHASTVSQGIAAGFKAIVLEKPSCASLEEVEMLRNLPALCSVLHGYRVMWGPRTIHRMIESGECGEVFCVEGRYWQSSSAQTALAPKKGRAPWKNDRAVNGNYDVLVDLGSHVVDLLFYFMGEASFRGSGWISYANSEAAHRDTHAHLNFAFPGGRRATASVSKTMHGAANDLEIVVIGTKRSVTWRFLSPDVVLIGEGSSQRTMVREGWNEASNLPAFHGLGWLEGYAEVLLQTARALRGEEARPVPTLAESLDVMQAIFSAEISQ